MNMQTRMGHSTKQRAAMVLNIYIVNPYIVWYQTGLKAEKVYVISSYKILSHSDDRFS
uniref:Uncharacterized protein n=1 Tax=Arundo donax TaxID=35708 RepID=A0A0A9DJ66_ARUDO